MPFHEQFRHGSARFADPDEQAAEGLTRPGGFFSGQNENGESVWSRQQSAVLMVGGARGGKGDNIIPSLLDGFADQHVISMDWKGQNGPITGLQPDTHIFNWSPRRSGGHRINAVSYLHIDSPTLGPDTKLFVQNWIPRTGAKDGEFFQVKAQRITEGCALAYVEQFGALDLPGFADVMALVGTDTEFWTAFEARMAESRFGSVRAVAEELLALRHSDNPNAGGFAGAKGEITNSFACLTDEDLRASVSPPFDFDPAELVEPNGPRFQVNLMEAMEFAQSSAPVVRAIYTSVMIYKRRHLGSRDQVWLLDEIGNIGRWPLAVELATFGPGFGIRPIYIVQSTAQLDNLAPRASQIIPNSCGTHIYRGIRDDGEARRVSSMLGDLTLEVEDFALNERARIEQARATDAMLFEGADPFDTGRALALQDALTVHKSKMRRALMTPDELRNMPSRMAIVFMPGVVPAPMKLAVPNYWTRRDLRGRYLGDPFHDAPGTVSIAGWFGRPRKARVITEPVPDQLAHLPQYQDGQWSYVHGFKPKLGKRR